MSDSESETCNEFKDYSTNQLWVIIPITTDVVLYEQSDDDSETEYNYSNITTMIQQYANITPAALFLIDSEIWNAYNISWKKFDADKISFKLIDSFKQAVDEIDNNNFLLLTLSEICALMENKILIEDDYNWYRINLDETIAPVGTLMTSWLCSFLLTNKILSLEEYKTIILLAKWCNKNKIYELKLYQKYSNFLQNRINQNDFTYFIENKKILMNLIINKHYEEATNIYINQIIILIKKYDSLLKIMNNDDKIIINKFKKKMKF